MPVSIMMVMGCETIRRTMNRIKEKFNYDEIFAEGLLNNNDHGSSRLNPNAKKDDTQTQMATGREAATSGRRKSTLLGLFINESPAAKMKKQLQIDKPMKADEFLKASEIV